MDRRKFLGSMAGAAVLPVVGSNLVLASQMPMLPDKIEPEMPFLPHKNRLVFEKAESKCPFGTWSHPATTVRAWILSVGDHRFGHIFSKQDVEKYRQDLLRKQGSIGRFYCKVECGNKFTWLLPGWDFNFTASEIVNDRLLITGVICFAKETHPVIKSLKAHNLKLNPSFIFAPGRDKEVVEIYHSKFELEEIA